MSAQQQKPCLTLKGVNLMNSLAKAEGFENGISHIKTLLAIAEGAKNIPEICEATLIQKTNIYKTLEKMNRAKLITLDWQRDNITIAKRANNLINYTEQD